VNGVRSTVLLCLVFIAIVLTAFVFNTTRVKTLSFEDLAKQGSIMLPTPRALAGIDLQTDKGDAFTEASLTDEQQGGWRFIFFGFTCWLVLTRSAMIRSRLASTLGHFHPALWA